jgi:hypothetical protein
LDSVSGSGQGSSTISLIQCSAAEEIDAALLVEDHDAGADGDRLVRCGRHGDHQRPVERLGHSKLGTTWDAPTM